MIFTALQSNTLLFLILTQHRPCVIHLEEASDGCGPTLVPVHPSHETTSLDVGSARVIGDSLNAASEVTQSIMYPPTCRFNILHVISLLKTSRCHS